jgi:hypothetical protein
MVTCCLVMVVGRLEMSKEQWWYDDLQEKIRKSRAKTCSRSTSFTTSRTCSHLGLKRGPPPGLETGV